ncbi:MAG: hypothetical protein JWN21_1118 [Sphingomonas bacterium]|nr:hypothetical protein [Sphingomonas bacterium]
MKAALTSFERYLRRFVTRRPRVTVTLLTLGLMLMVLAIIPRPLSPDVLGQLWIADRLRGGARLYLDISEVNPPLWFWMAVPLQAMADGIHAHPDRVLAVSIGAAALLSLLTTDRLLRERTPAARVMFLAYAAAILLIMPLRDLGQREQWALITTLPYVALIARRRDGRQVPHWLALLIGVQAAVGFALKHYFIGAPILLEIWLLLRLRRDWRPIRSETVALAACAIAYAAAIMVWTPAFLAISVPETALAYSAASVPEWRYMLRPAQPIWALIIAGIVMRRQATRQSLPALPALSIALLVAAAGFGIAWLLQLKGWPYHSIPVTGLLALALAALVMDMPRLGLVRPVLLAGLCAPLLLAAVPTQWRPTPEEDIAPALADLRAGAVVGVLAREGWTTWPATADRGFRINGRHGALWILSAIDRNASGARDPRIYALGRRMVRRTARDYRCLPPERIIFYPGRASKTATSASDNPLLFFSRDPEFAAVLSHYRRLALPGRFDAFTLDRPLPRLPPSQCPR